MSRVRKSVGSRESRLPTVALMHADEVARPFHHDGRGTAVRFISRAGKEHSRRFADLTAAIRALPPASLILDGEVALFDDKLISRFEWFRKRPDDAASTPPIYMAFDCLYLEGRDLRPLALRERRAELERVGETDHTLIFPARRLAANGLEAWAQVVEQGYEGLVANDEASAYRGGRDALMA